MKDKDYRELQLSSSQLVFIFIAVLILGVVIFLLGVSVGKKQAQITENLDTSTQPEIEQVKEKTPLPIREPKDSIRKELVSHQKIKDETQKQTLTQEEKNLYYVQIGAFNNREAALSHAEKFQKKGYNTLVLDPLSSDKKQVFRVRIGEFKTREKAEEVRLRLKSETKKKSDYFIIKS